MVVKLFEALGVVSLLFVKNQGRGSMYCTVGWFDENMGGGSVMEWFRVVLRSVGLDRGRKVL